MQTYCKQTCGLCSNGGKNSDRIALSKIVDISVKSISYYVHHNTFLNLPLNFIILEERPCGITVLM